jgi:ABC-type transport system substrate-binding protein
MMDKPFRSDADEPQALTGPAEQLLDVSLSRRRLLRRAVLLGLGAPVLGGLLAACGDDDDDDDDGGDGTPAVTGTTPPAAQATNTTAAPQATTAAPAATTAPEAPTATTGATAPDATATTGGAAQPELDGTPGGTLRWGLLRDPIAFDPHINYGASSSSLQGNVYDMLVEYDREGNIIGALAESWEASDDGLEYVLNLRQGVVFQDGAAFDAEDVVANFDRIMNEETGASRRAELSNVGSYEATDQYTVTLTLPQPYATLLPVLATDEMAMADKDWLESGVDPTQEMNGTGAFILDTFEKEVRYVLVKNPNYWKEGLPYLDSIEQMPIPDDNARMNALRSGEITYAEYVPWQNMAEFAEDDNYTSFKGFDTYNIVRLNPSRPPLDNKLVRQALNYAIDRDAVIAVAFGGEGEAMTTGLFPQDSPWYHQELEGHWTYDPDRAMELLAEAGVDPSSVTLDFAVATISVHSDTGQVVAQQLEDLGFTVNIIQQDVPTLTERRTTGDYQMMQDGLSLSYPDPDAYSFYFDIGGAAYARGVGYENQTLADLLEQGRSEPDPEKRKEIYRQFEEALLDEALWIFILFRPQAEVMAANVMGYERLSAIGLDSQGYAEYIWIDE